MCKEIIYTEGGLSMEEWYFSKANLLEMRKMSIEELTLYYAELRKYEYNKGVPLKGIKLRKKIHFLINIILKIDEILSQEKIIKIGDEHTKDKKKPKIFACTHIGGNDVQRVFQIIKEPAYLMFGNPGEVYKELIYQALKLNGVIPLNTDDKTDRHIAYNRAAELLKKGGNLLIFPEGAWNITPNVFVMKLFTGTVRLAKETGADIIPIGVEQYGKYFYYNIGKNYSIPSDTTKSIDYYTDELRGILAALKFEIMESQPVLQRKDIPNDYLKTFQDEIINRCNYTQGFTIEDAIKERFHDKNVTTEEEAFAFFENLEITQDNCFLARTKNEFIRTRQRI